MCIYKSKQTPYSAFTCIIIVYSIYTYFHFPFFFQAHSQREESYVKLLKHREGLKTDKHNLGEHEREHTRLQKICTRQDNLVNAY